VVLLDLGLPDLDGLEVTRRLREWSQVPIIVISARGQEADKVAALDAGADDYVTKPFGVDELLARIRVALRHRERSADNPDPVFESGDLRVDLHRRQVFAGGREVHLTPIEYKLLATLIRHAGRVITHRQLLTEVWGVAYAAQTQYLRVFMGQLRHKTEADPARPAHLQTEPGVGTGCTSIDTPGRGGASVGRRPSSSRSSQRADARLARLGPRQPVAGACERLQVGRAPSGFATRSSPCRRRSTVTRVSPERDSGSRRSRPKNSSRRARSGSPSPRYRASHS